MASKAIETLYNDNIFKIIRDKSSDEIFNIIPIVENYWTFDLEKRSPNVIFEEDGTKITDLDMLTFLYSLKNRHAVIKIPKYKSLRAYDPTKVKEVVINTSKDRHGKILKLTSNENTFNFSVMLNDMTIMTSSDVGKARLFTITDFDGNWYDGWETIDFIPDVKENQYIIEHYLTDNQNKITFDTFISNQRWVTFFSKHYILTKCLIQELKERAQHYYKIMTDMKKSKLIKFTPTTKDIPTGNMFDDSSDKIKKEKKSIVATAFNVEIDLLDNTSEYAKIDYTIEEYLRIKQLRNDIIHKYCPILQVMTRAAEYGHFKNPDLKPSWITENWEHRYKLSGKQLEWDKLVLLNNDNGYISIRKRTFDKKETVSDNYEE